MYKCNNCYNLIPYAIDNVERHGFTYGRFEEIQTCPLCHAADVEYVEEGTKLCGGCEHRIWHGDLNAHYCDITKKLVHRDDECSCTLEDEE